jgi:leader peptidase (prepilin peptidase)/N-methyltransferase
MALEPAGALELSLLGWAGHAVAAVLGALFGSFANVCIVRWPPSDEHPHGRSVVRPGSHCPRCGAPVRWYDNIPIASYFILKGRCRSCGGGFSARYALVEAATAMLFAAVYHLEVVLLFPGEPMELRLTRFAIAAAFVFVLVVISFIDLDTKLILNLVTYPAIPIFYGLGLLLPERGWADGLVGAVVGYGIIRLVADGYHLLRRRRGLGYGDGKLLAMVGAYLGWHAVATSLFLGSILGSIIGSAYLVWSRARGTGPSGQAGATSGVGGVGDEGEAGERDAVGGEAREVGEVGQEGDAGPELQKLRHVEIPFGPFLAAAAVVYLFVEPWLRIHFWLLYH